MTQHTETFEGRRRKRRSRQIREIEELMNRIIADDDCREAVTDIVCGTISGFDDEAYRLHILRELRRVIKEHGP